MARPHLVRAHSSPRDSNGYVKLSKVVVGEHQPFTFRDVLQMSDIRQRTIIKVSVEFPISQAMP